MKTTPVKRLVSLLLVLVLMLGLLPGVSMAAEYDTAQTAIGNNENSDSRYDEQASVSVSYDDADRTHATVRYHKEGVTANSYNLVFLMDISVSGHAAVQNFEKIMVEGGADSFFNYGAKNSATFIGYRTTPVVKTDVTSSHSLYSAIAATPNLGQGVADEVRGLQEAVKAVQAFKTDTTRRQYPTVVVWVMGDKFTCEESRIQPELQALKNTLDETGEAETDALITWQLGTDTPNALLSDFASAHTGAHDDTLVRAAHASSDPATFRSGLRNSLESIVHDHYHNIDFSLSLSKGQTVVKNVENIYLESEADTGQITITPTANHNSVDIHLDWLCQQVSYDLVFELELDPDVYEKQTVIDGGVVRAPHDSTNGGIYTGIFDDHIQDGLSTTYPATIIDRTRHTLTFDLNGGNGTQLDAIQALPGQSITLPDGMELTRMGTTRTGKAVTEQFSGWRVGGEVYRSGARITMPEYDTQATALYGHIEVEVDVAAVTPGQTGKNQMAERSGDQGVLYEQFVSKNLDKIAAGSYLTFTFIDQNYIGYIFDPATNRIDPDTLQGAVLAEGYSAYHLGATADDHVVAYVADDSRSSGGKKIYDIVIAAPGGVHAPTNCARFFSQDPSKKLTVLGINDLSLLDTSGVTNMSGMFYGCAGIGDVSQFDTSAVTHMSTMFYSTGAIAPDVSKWDTSKVTAMDNMFGRSGVTKLDVSKWDTSNVTTMYRMFHMCGSLRDLDVSNWNTAKVRTMESAFQGCGNLQMLDVSKWDTSKVANMQDAFVNCAAVQELDLSEWDMSKAILIRMFKDCTQLQTITFPTEAERKPQKQQNLNGLFQNCTELTALDLSGWDVSGVRNMGVTFAATTALKELKLDGWRAQAVVTFEGTFRSCGLETIDLSPFAGSKPTTVKSMFQQSRLKTIDMTGIDLSNAASFSDMFNTCPELISVTGITLGAVNQASGCTRMFKDCRKLELVEFTAPTGVTPEFPMMQSMDSMFYNCKLLGQVTLGPWVTPDLTDFTLMFYSDTDLENITMDFHDAHVQTPENVTTMNMFYGVPQNATLTLSGDGSALETALKNAFRRGINAQDDKQTLDTPPEDAFPIEDDLLPFESKLTEEESPAGTTGDAEDTDELENEFDGPAEGEAPSVDEAERENADALAEAVRLLRMDPDIAVMSNGIAPAAPNENIIVHPTQTDVGNSVQYRVRVHYVGDSGAKSHLIKLSFPLPQDMGYDPATTNIAYSGAISESTTLVGGYVVDDSVMYDQTEKALTAQLNALSAGCYIEFNIDYDVLQTKKVGDYYFWDGTAQAADRYGSVSSRTYRLWKADNTNPQPPAATYRLEYTYTGDVPADMVPPAVSYHAENESVKAAPAPTAASYPDYYQFEGWIRSDDGTVHPGTDFTMPAKDLTLIGVWTVDQTAVPEICIQYNYDGAIPIGVPTVPANEKVKLNGEYYPNTNLLKNYSTLRYKLGSIVDGQFVLRWTPSLMVGTDNVPLTTTDNGVSYTGNLNGQTYLIMTSDAMELSQFQTDAAAGRDVVLTYAACWEPYRGSIVYNANGGKFDVAGEETVTAETNIAFDAACVLKTPDALGFEPYADNISFLGWSLTPGGMVLDDSVNPANLIRQDGQTLTLYARWYVNNIDHSVELDLTGVTASNQQRSVAPDAAYGNQLTVANGHLLNSVYVTMGGVDITATAWDAGTGKISITRVTGDLVIRAIATRTGNQPQQPDPGKKPDKPSSSDADTSGVSRWLNTKNHIAFMIGYDTGNFAPDTYVTRAQVAQIFYRVLNNQDIPLTASFIDVEHDAWYASAVQTLASLGVVVGVGDGRFEPDRAITRAEFTAIASRFAKASTSNAVPFTDVSVSAWYYANVQTAVAYGWLIGYADHTFRPNNTITRAEAATIVNRMLARSADTDFIAKNENVRRFSDVSTDYWAYADIMEAANAHDYSIGANNKEVWSALK